jgi:hypothetical protein
MLSLARLRRISKKMLENRLDPVMVDGKLVYLAPDPKGLLEWCRTLDALNSDGQKKPTTPTNAST